MLGQNSAQKEVEIKLYVDKKSVKQIYESSLFATFSQSPWRTKELLNQYIDTDDYALTKAKVALRVRKDNNVYIQTLKARGNSVGGFSEREEIDWYLTNPSLDISLLDGKYWPKTLEKLDKTALHDIFSTDFIRHYSLFTWLHEGEEAEIEVALDTGIIQAGQQQDTISEVELELKQGSANAMLAFAVELAKVFPLMPSDSSKAERGYRLLNPQNYSLPVLDAIPDMPLERVRYCLGASQRLWESYLWQPSASKVQQWFEVLRILLAQLGVLKEYELHHLLEAIISDWQPVINDTAEAQHAKACEETTKTRLGVFLLMISHWLLNKV